MLRMKDGKCFNKSKNAYYLFSNGAKTLLCQYASPSAHDQVLLAFLFLSLISLYCLSFKQLSGRIISASAHSLCVLNH